MNEERVVQMTVSVSRSEVVLQGTQTRPPLEKPDTFHVEKGDTLKWVVSGAPATAKVRVRFVGHPGERRLSLFEDGRDVLEAVAGVITSGAVAGQAFAGRYSYLVELVEGQAVTNLTCVWTDGTQTVMTGMGGGVQSGGPSAP